MNLIAVADTGAVISLGFRGTFMVLQGMVRMLLRKIFLLMTHIGNNPVYF